MSKTVNKYSIFFALALIAGFGLSTIPQSVSATSFYVYVCSNGDYDPMEGTDYNKIQDPTGYTVSKANYIAQYEHEYGLCKGGAEPTQTITTPGYVSPSGYVCPNGDYDPREGVNYNNIKDSNGYTASKAIYLAQYGHGWGLCKGGSQPTPPPTITTPGYVSPSGYICGDGDYDPMDGSGTIPPDIYSLTHSHVWGRCNDGSLPTPPDPSPTVGCTNILAFDCNESGGNLESSGLWKLLLDIINILTAGISIAVVGGVVYGAFLYTSDGGNSENVKKAKTLFMNIGLGVGAYLLMYAFLNFLIPGGIFN